MYHLVWRVIHIETRWLYDCWIVTPLTLSQCTLAGPVYTGMPLECHLLTQCTLGYHWATQRVLAGYTRLNTTGKKVETAPHRNATGETLTIAAYTGTPLGLQQSTNIQAHIVKQNSIHASLKWQDGGTTISKWAALCKFSFYFEFTALQWIPVLFFKRVSTSTLLCACLRCEQHYRFCIFGVAV